MTILHIQLNFPGQEGLRPRRCKMICTDNLSTITTAGYINPNAIYPQQVMPTDVFDVIYSYTSATGTGTYGQFTPSISGSGSGAVITLNQDTGGLTPSNPALSTVASVSGTITSGHVASYNDTSGTVKDAGYSAANVQLSALSNPDNISDLVWQDVPCAASALATGGSVTIQASSGSKQYKVRDIRMNYSASGLSGGGGDRLLQVSDGTTVYNNAGITAALLGTPINTIWGGTGNPLAGTVAMNTSSAAGAAIVAKYAGGTTDFTTGTVTLSVLVQRVA